MLDFTAIERRFSSLSSKRSNFEVTWQEISDHIRGDRDFTRVTTQGRQRTRLIYDSTGMFSWDILASALQNFVLNPETDWFDLTTEDPRLMDVEENIAWLWHGRNTLKALVERPEAGLTGQSQEMLSDFVGYGTAGMFVEDVPGLPIRFSHRPLGELFIAENAAGLVDTVIRKFSLSHRAAVQEFGADAIPRVAGMVRGEPDAESEYLQTIHQTDDPAMPPEMRRAPWRVTFASRLEKKIVRERFLTENPAVIARWSTRNGEVYGRSPGWTALPEQRMLNAMTKTLIEGAQLAIRPPFLVADDGVIHPLNLNPAGQNVHRSASFSTDPIKFLETKGEHGLAVEMFDRRRQAVRSAFLHDLLELLQQLIPTATQVVEIVARARALFAPTLGRLQSEAIEPMLNRAFRIALRANAFPPPPPGLAGAKLKVVYRNPVSRSQKASDAAALDQWISFVANLAGIVPEVLDNVNMDEAVRAKHRMVGTVPEALRGKDEVAKRREAQLRSAEQHQQMQTAMAAAQAAGRAAPALKLLQGGNQAA